MTNPADSFFGGAPGLSWPKANNGAYTDTELLGVIRGGVIADDAQVQNMTAMGTGQPLLWPDGKPKQQIVITLICDGRGQGRDERNPQNATDDGRRRLYIRGPMVKAVGDAIHKSGAPGLRIGGELYVCWTGSTPSQTKGNDPARTWAAMYIPPATVVPGQQTDPAQPPADPWGQPGPYPGGVQQGANAPISANPFGGQTVTSPPQQPVPAQTAPQNPFGGQQPAPALTQNPGDPWGQPAPAPVQPQSANPWG